jgi:hypothetical protein
MPFACAERLGRRIEFRLVLVDQIICCKELLGSTEIHISSPYISTLNSSSLSLIFVGLSGSRAEGWREQRCRRYNTRFPPYLSDRHHNAAQCLHFSAFFLSSPILAIIDLTTSIFGPNGSGSGQAQRGNPIIWINSCVLLVPACSIDERGQSNRTSLRIFEMPCGATKDSGRVLLATFASPLLGP